MNRPGVASVIVGATKLTQLQQNIAALSFEIPSELQDRLDAVSAPERGFPYTLFGDEVQGMPNGLKTKMLAHLDREGLAAAMIAERVKHGGKIIEVVRFRITAAGLRALED